MLISVSLRRKTVFMRKNPLPAKTIAICHDVSGGTQTLHKRDSIREFYGGSGVSLRAWRIIYGMKFGEFV